MKKSGAALPLLIFAINYGVKHTSVLQCLAIPNERQAVGVLAKSAAKASTLSANG